VPEWFGDLVDLRHNQNVFVHTGLLTLQRDPSALLELFVELADSGVPIVFRQVGKVDDKLRASQQYAEVSSKLKDRGLYEEVRERVDYRTAMSEMAAARCVVVLSPGEPESPFFPAKLADALSIEAPILSIAPKKSVVYDITGLSFDLTSTDDRLLLKDALVKLARGELARFSPKLAAHVSPKSALNRFEAAVTI